jgi:hypothetical protein
MRWWIPLVFIIGLLLAIPFILIACVTAYPHIDDGPKWEDGVLMVWILDSIVVMAIVTALLYSWNLNRIGRRSENPMEKKSLYSRSNIIYFLIVRAGWIGIQILRGERSSYEMGESFGTLFALWLLPSLIAWILWRLNGRKESTFSLTFNIVLSVVLFGQLGALSESAQKTGELERLKRDRDSLAASYNTDSPEDVGKLEAAKKKHNKDILRTLEGLAKSSSGKEKQFYEIMLTIASESQQIEASWEAAYATIMDESIFDMSLLHSNGEIARQTKVIKKYISETQIYEQSFLTRIPRWKKALSPLGEEFPMAIGAIRGAEKKNELQKVVMILFIEAHVAYGNQMIKIIEYLGSDLEAWIYANEEVRFEDDMKREVFSDLIEEMTEIEAKVNELASQLVI